MCIRFIDNSQHYVTLLCPNKQHSELVHMHRSYSEMNFKLMFWILPLTAIIVETKDTQMQWIQLLQINVHLE